MLRRRFGFLIVAVVSSACTLPFVEQPRPDVRVLVYNIHAGKDASGQPNLEEVARLIHAHGADVVLLQEVDKGTRRSGNVDQLEVLIAATGFDGAFGRTLDYDGGQYGIAALARDGFGYEDTVPLRISPPQARAGGSYEPRGALVTIVNTRIGRWQAITTHLDASAGDEYRQQEADQLHDIVRARLATRYPLMLGGDMNATPDSAVIEKVRGFGWRDAWTECGTGDGFTYPAARPTRRIDYLFLTGTLRCTSAEVIDSQASDHRPLLVSVSMLTDK